jgi:hypothetical protein
MPIGFDGRWARIRRRVKAVLIVVFTSRQPRISVLD